MLTPQRRWLLWSVFATSIVAALWVSGERPIAAQQKHPLEEKGIRSTKGDFSSSLRFQNNTAQAVKIFWLDFDGKRVLLATLQVGDSYEISKAGLNHPYLVTDEKDNAQGLYFADAQARSVALGGAPPGGAGGFGGFKGGKGKGKGGGGPGFGTPSLLKGVQNPLIQDELKLTKEQLAKLADIEKKDAADQTAARLLPAAQARTKVGDLIKDSDAAVTALLTPAQNQRLTQIKRQHPIAAVWTNTELIQALKLTPDQQTKFNDFQNESKAGVTQASKQFGPGGFGAANDQYSQKLVEIRTSLHAKAVAILDAEQKKVWKEWVGDSFKHYTPATVFNVTMPGAGGFGGGGGFALPSYTLGSLATSSARFLVDKSVQDELKMTDAQRQGVPAKASVRTQIPADLLTPAQLQRYRGIYVQQIMTAYGPAAPFRVREVIEVLNLTDDQKQKITSIGLADETELKEKGTPVKELDAKTQALLEKVLTPEQRTKLQEFLGPIFQGAIANPYRVFNQPSGTRTGWSLNSPDAPKK